MNLNVSSPQSQRGFDNIMLLPQQDRLSAFATPVLDIMPSSQHQHQGKQGLDKAKMLISSFKPQVDEAFDKRRIKGQKARWGRADNNKKPCTKKHAKTTLATIFPTPGNNDDDGYAVQPKTARATVVRFALDENGNIAEDCNAATRNLSKQDIKNTWWTRKELKACRERAQESCKLYLDCRPDYKRAAARMLIRCGAQKTPGCSASKSKQTDLANLFDKADEDEEADVRTIVEADSRGLEKRLINALNLPFFRHKRSIQSVMDTQQRLQQMEAGFFSSDQQSRLIASQYGLNARYASAWARKMAQGDANNASFLFAI